MRTGAGVETTKTVADKASVVDYVTEAHVSLLRDRSLQFDRVEVEPIQPPPPWMRAISDFFEAIGPALQWVFWLAVAIAAALIIWFIVREIIRLRAPLARPKPMIMGREPDWRPNAGDARDLLDAADKLAADGRYAEAAHLLLLRSVEDIQSRRPKSLRVSFTTREIASLSVLPESARPAFAQIGRVVERSLFGGGGVDADDFTRCRRAYEAFALPNGWSA